MSVVLPPIPPTVALLTGPILIGHSINYAFFGVLTVQCYLYYVAFPKDRNATKALVAMIYIAEFIQVIVSTRQVFADFATGFGNMLQVNTVGWFWWSTPMSTAAVSCVVQNFFAWRVYNLSGKKPYIPIVIVLLSLTQCGAGWSSGINAHVIGKFSLLQDANYIRSTIWLAGSAICDIVIAISMIYYLVSSRSEFASTNSIIGKFIMLTLQTGFACATFASLDVIFFLAYRKNNLHTAPAMCLSKLYSNSLLVVLNARMMIQNGRGSQGTSMSGPDISMSRIQWAAQRTQGETRGDSKTINVAISTVQEDDSNEIPQDYPGATSSYIDMKDRTAENMV